MATTGDQRRLAVAHEVQSLLPRAARAYDQWRADTGTSPALGVSTRRKLARQIAKERSPGFGIAEVMLIVQAIMLAFAIYERFFREDVNYKATANPTNSGKFSGTTLVASVVSEITGGDI